jgi:hypothetical protein
MPLLTITEFKAVELKWLNKEIQKHNEDILTNRGKVQELQELKVHVESLCDYCGERMFGIYDTNTEAENFSVILKHMDNRHPEDLEAFLEARKEETKESEEMRIES